MSGCLRLLQAEDAEALYPLVAGTTVTDTLLWDGPESLESFRQAIAERAALVAEGKLHQFTILDPASGLPAGSCSLRPYSQPHRADIGLWIGLPYQRRGLGVQVVAELLAYGFQTLGLEKIEAFVFTGNRPSRRIFEKNGFTLEGTIRLAVEKRGRFLDEWQFGITCQDYTRIQNGSPWLVHLCTRAAWEAAQAAGEYRAPSLEEQGFIHCSRPDQIPGVLERFFPGSKDVLLLWIEPQRLQAPLFWEAGDNDLFPHLYGPLNLEAVRRVEPLSG